MPRHTAASINRIAWFASLKGALDVDRAIWAHVDTQGCRKSSYESCLAPLAARVTTP